jgi:ribose 5-phosphate isomerase B
MDPTNGKALDSAVDPGPEGSRTPDTFSAHGSHLGVEAPSRIGIASDHGGHELKNVLINQLAQAGFEVKDFGDAEADPEDDYPDFIVPMAQALARREVDRGLAVCGSGVGACLAANRINGVRACLVHDSYSVRQGVEDDNLNLLCLGGQVVGQALAWDLVRTFLSARFSGAERHRRRLAKVAALPLQEPNSWA